MKKTLLIMFLFSISLFSYTQTLQNSNWCFLQNARLDFNTSPPSVSTCASHLTAGDIYGGSSASVSGQNGQLLFYTDGVTVWNKVDNIITGGTNIGGGVDNTWGKQTTIIVPLPGSESIYYIFTTNFYYSNTPTGIGGVHYTAVDMSPGNEHVIPTLKNVPLNDENGTPIEFNYSTNTGSRLLGSRITSTLNANKDKVWVTLFTRFDENNLAKRHAYSYLVSSCGVNQNPIKHLLLDNANYPDDPSQNSPVDDFGCLKISPNGTYLCDNTLYSLNLYNFDNQTGDITFNKIIYSPPYPRSTLNSPGRGLEFSPNSQLIYYSIQSNTIFQDNNIREGQTKNVVIMQYNMARRNATKIGAFDIPWSSTIGQSSTTPIPDDDPEGALQLAIDNKIYVCDEVALAPMHGRLGVIQNPDIVGLGCNFLADAVQLLAGTSHEGSLPQWVHKATVTGAVSCEIWPKVYDAVETLGDIQVDYNGNIINSFLMNNMSNNINHSGPTSNNSSTYSVQYNKFTGNTTWFSQDTYHPFAMSNGNIQFNEDGMHVPGTFRNATTGMSSSGPNYVPPFENMIAEDNGVYITSNINHITTSSWKDELWVHSSSANNMIQIPQISLYWSSITRTVFNPTTKRLFVNYLYHPYMGNMPQRNFLAIYKLSNSNLSSIPPSYYEINYPMIEVNSSEEVFVFENTGIIQKYDYQNNSYISLPSNNNSSLTRIYTRKQTVEDKILALNYNDNKIYCFNTNSSLTKSIAVTLDQNFATNITSYFMDADDIYITGGYNSSSFTIGNQTMPLLGNLSAFITKFSFQGDFNFRSNISTISQAKNAEQKSNALSVIATLTPNPTYNSLLIKLKPTDVKSFSNYKISITNSFQEVLITKNTQRLTESINVSALKPGFYFVNITTSKGETVSRTFIKE